MFHIPDDTLARLIAEDLPHGDLTTRSLGLAGPARLEMRARGAMTLCASEEAARIFGLLGARAEALMPSGASLCPDALVLTAEGPAEAILAGWKVAQVLVEWCSGIATAAAGVVAAARSVRPDIVVACTRKPAPLTRALSLKAVTMGGAAIHRTGLSESVLLFPEHRALAPSVSLADQVARLKARCPERRIVVEAASTPDALEAAEAGADVIQLEKFAPEAVTAFAALLPANWRGTLAAAGGITAANAAHYAGSGAAVLVTSWPYTAPPADISVRIRPA